MKKKSSTAFPLNYSAPHSSNMAVHPFNTLNEQMNHFPTHLRALPHPMVSSSYTLNAVHDREGQLHAPSPTQSPLSKPDISTRHRLNHIYRLSQTTPTFYTIATCATRYMTSLSTSSHTAMTTPDTPLHSCSNNSFHKSNPT